MPSRLIRDEILDSERVCALPFEARWLYVSILLTADDLGLFEANMLRLSRKAGVSREAVEGLMQSLADADLVRLYMVDGRTFGFIPRYGQRVQIKRTKWPLPPKTIFSGDDDALNKFNELTSKITVDSGGSPRKTESHGETPPELELEPEVKPYPSIGSETNSPSQPSFSLVAGATDADKPKKPKPDEPDGFAELWSIYPKRSGGNPRRDAAKAVRARLSEGDTLELMRTGLERYAAHLKATNRLNTEFVMQGQRFFGPSRIFAEWALAAPESGGEAMDRKMKNAFL